MDNEDTKLVLVEIRTTEELAQRLRENRAALEAALAPTAVKVVPVSASGLKAVDPLTVSVLIAVAAKSATAAVAGLVARDIYCWMREQAKQMQQADGPEQVELVVSAGEPIPIPVAGTDKELASAETRIAKAIEGAAAPAGPKG